jgi:Tfp pilus assembly protein PilF
MNSSKDNRVDKNIPPGARAQTPGSRHKGRGIVICVLLAVAVFLVFGQTVRHSFVNFDDDEYFSANPHVQAGLTWPGVLWAVHTTYASNWHPLTWWSMMLDVQLFGTGPFGPHFTNMLFHAANTVLVFLLLTRLTGAYGRSAFVAALFAVHPLHVESVAWISERKDVLSAFFGLLTLLMYARYAQRRSSVVGRESIEKPSPGLRPPSPACAAEAASARRRPVGRERDGVRAALDSRLSTLDYSVALLFFALGLMSKSMLVTLPFVMLLLDYWPLKRVSSLGFGVSSAPAQALWSGSASNSKPKAQTPKLIIEKLPFFALSLASAVITVLAQREAVQPLAHIAIDVRIVNAINSCIGYLVKMFWPAALAIPYPHPGYGLFWRSCLSALLLVAITFAVIRDRLKHPFLVTGWFWYLGMLAPVIGLVQVGMQAMADRYTYLPLIGVFVILAWGANEILARRRARKAAVGAAAGLVLTACGVRALDQLQYWTNSETLFQHAVAVTAQNDTAYYNLGEFYLKADTGEDRLDKAIDNLRRAIEIRPDYDDALNNLGVALALKGQLDEALARIQEAIHIEPHKADAYYNLGNVYVRQQNLDAAANAFSEAIRLKPDYPEAHNNLATTLLIQGHRDRAIRHYREALRLNPNHAGARRQLQALGALPP